MTAPGKREFKLDADKRGTVMLSGKLNFDTAADAMEEIRAALAKGGVTQLDLAGVERGDSAGLSCIVAITAESAQNGHPLQVVNMPEGLRALAQVCEVGQLLA